jgi:hypothetical protein
MVKYHKQFPSNLRTNAASTLFVLIDHTAVQNFDTQNKKVQEPNPVLTRAKLPKQSAATPCDAYSGLVRKEQCKEARRTIN